MAKAEHITILKQGARIWNDWRRETGERPDLSRAFLSRLDLKGANLESAAMEGANLIYSDVSDADLRDANLGGANLNGADLSRSILNGASLRGAVLDHADMSEARLFYADFTNSSLLGAKLTRAELIDTQFGNCDLRGIEGLKTVIHRGPSTLGIDTIYKSNGKIPASFLRGCGAPEGFIRQMHPLIAAEEGVQFYSCFVSHSSENEEFARRLHARIRQARIRVWLAPKDAETARAVHEPIEPAIRAHDKLLMVLSKASLQSKWVMNELRKARKAGRKSGQRNLFPVRLVSMKTLQMWECINPDTGEDLALEVRKYQIPDFSQWTEHDAFETAFARLLEDLRA